VKGWRRLAWRDPSEQLRGSCERRAAGRERGSPCQRRSPWLQATPRWADGRRSAPSGRKRETTARGETRLQITCFAFHADHGDAPQPTPLLVSQRQCTHSVALARPCAPPQTHHRCAQHASSPGLASDTRRAEPLLSKHPPLPSTPFAHDPSLRQVLEADLKAVDWATATLREGRAERRRRHQNERAALEEEARSLENEIERLARVAGDTARGATHPRRPLHRELIGKRATSARGREGRARLGYVIDSHLGVASTCYDEHA
jgi:hypothetical protein